MNGQATDQRRRQALPTMRRADVSEAVQRQAGGLVEFQSSHILRTGMLSDWKNEDIAQENNLSLAGAQDAKGIVRGLRRDEAVACPPLRWEPSEQRSDKSSNVVPILSRLLACALEEARYANFWADAASGASWEDGVPRVACGVKNRMDRLRALGNAIVPQLAEAIGRALPL